MYRALIFVGFVALNVGAVCAGANAASVYAASATATIDLASIAEGLVFRGARINYGANAQATSDGSTQVVDKPGSTTAFGSSDPQFENLFPTPPNINFQTVDAFRGGAEGHGRNSYSSSSNITTFGAEAFGQATDPVEFASSRVRWDVLIAFENITTEALVASWTVAYVLANSATADPRGTAFASSRVRVQRSTFVDGHRVPEDGFFEAETASCGATTTCDPGTKPDGSFVFNLNLAAGEIGYLNVEVVAEGNASGVPLPAAMPLFGSGLVLIGCIGWRRKRKVLARLGD